jgi:hypothetical protein
VKTPTLVTIALPVRNPSVVLVNAVVIHLAGKRESQRFTVFGSIFPLGLAGK